MPTIGEKTGSGLACCVVGFTAIPCARSKVWYNRRRRGLNPRFQRRRRTGTCAGRHLLSIAFFFVVVALLPEVHSLSGVLARACFYPLTRPNIYPEATGRQGALGLSNGQSILYIHSCAKLLSVVVVMARPKGRVRETTGVLCSGPCGRDFSFESIDCIFTPTIRFG